MNDPRASTDALRALVVDDDADAAAATAEVLALHGFRASAAAGGEAAVRAALADPPDVVLLDLAMPGVSGFEVARRIRDAVAPGGRRPLLVAVTGLDSEADRARTTAAGFDLHLAKPVEPAVLVGLLRRFGRAVADPRGG